MVASRELNGKQSGGWAMNNATRVDSSWYDALVGDCKDIIVEGIFASRWALIKTYHNLGTRILAENDNFERSKIYGKAIASRVSRSLGKSTRTIERSMQFARKFPDLNLLPEGKNISWHKLCNNLLPEPKKPQTPPLPEGNYSVIYADPPWRHRLVS